MLWPWCVIGGYLLGSVSPAFILGKLIKGIDIRECGTHNAGTVNTFHVLGLGPAIITAAFDLMKGLLAMYLCWLAGGSPFFIHLAGLAAILGHVFPFYLGFRGGQGVATATAMLIFYLVTFTSQGWLPSSSLFLLGWCVLCFSWIARKGEIVGLVILSFLSFFVLAFPAPSSYRFFLLSIVGYILFINIFNICKQKILDLSLLKAKGVIGWRLYLRPVAFLLLIYYLHAEKKSALILIGSITLFFLLADLTRLFSPSINVFFFRRVKAIYKDKEYKRFSSMTIFLFALFLTVLLFEEEVAVLASAYLIFGDFFSKVFGLCFGRRRIFEKSLEGSLAHLNICLVAGFILMFYFSIPEHLYLVGALVASVSEVLPLGIDDNFSVSLLSGSAMYVVRFF